MLNRTFAAAIGSFLLLFALGLAGCASHAPESGSAESTNRMAATQSADTRMSGASATTQPAVSAASAQSLFDNIAPPPPSDGVPPAPATPSPASLASKKVCPNCHFANEHDAAACVKCGTKLN